MVRGRTWWRGGSGGGRHLLCCWLRRRCLWHSRLLMGRPKLGTHNDERRLPEQNKKIQEANRAPDDFPNFIREDFEVRVVTSDNYITWDSGLMYEDIKVGFEEGALDMKPGGKRRIIIHPELGPPLKVGHRRSSVRSSSKYSDVVCS